VIRGALLNKVTVVHCAKILEIREADEHTVVRFYQKRVPCSCLDEKYKEVKSVTKMGICGNPSCSLPERKATRSKMLYCTRCEQANYCSQECQVADWTSHKQLCNFLVDMKVKAELDSKE
jgi:hypothetical protein